MKVLLVDFEDSFTFNILGELKTLNITCEVIHWTDFHSELSFDLLILGPGPGHPHDYTPIFNDVRKVLEEGRNVWGICLGHQLIWNLEEALVTRSKYPMHGQQVTLALDEFWSGFFEMKQLTVQRYNSLAVLEHSVNSEAELLSFDNEVMMSLKPGVLGCQFHPESLGTKHRHKIFQAVIRYFQSRLDS